MPVDTSEAVKVYMDKYGTSDAKAPGHVMNEIKVGMTYDPNAGEGDPTVASGAKAQREAKKLPGAFWDHGGTTQFNPLRTDPRVEAILGPLEYKQAISKESPEEMRLTIAKLQQQNETILKMLGAQVSPEVIAPVITEVDKPDYEKMTYGELLSAVKSMYPDLRGRPKKEDILRMIANKEG